MALTEDERARRIEDWRCGTDGRALLTQQDIDALMRRLGVENDSARWAEKPYYADRPALLTKKQTRALGIMAEEACRALTEQLSAYTKQLCHFHVASVDELSYAEFVRSLPVPAVAACARWGESRIAVQVDGEIASGFAYGELLGDLESFYRTDELDEGEEAGLGIAISQIRKRGRGSRALTGMELVFLRESMVRALLAVFAGAFAAGRERALPCGGAEPPALPPPGNSIMQTDPAFLEAADETEMTAVITLQGKIGEDEGVVALCLPRGFVRGELLRCGVLQKEAQVQRAAGGKTALVSLGAFALPGGKPLQKGDLFALAACDGGAVELYDTERGAVIAQGEVVVRVTDCGGAGA